MVKKRKKSKASQRTRRRADRYTAHDRAEVLAELGEQLMSDVAEAQLAFLYDEFYGDVEAQPVSASPESMDFIRETSHLAFTCWAFFDARSPAGKLWLDFLVERTRRTAGQRAFVRAMRQTRLRLHEVVAVDPGASVTLRLAVGDHRRVKVREVNASRQLREGQLIATRVMQPGVSGEPEMDGGFFSYRDVQRAHVLAAAIRENALLESENPDRPPSERWPELAPVLHQEWRTVRLAAPEPELAEPTPHEEPVSSNDDPTTVEQL